MLLLGFAFFTAFVTGYGAVLYPQDTQSREVKNLNGVWDFRISDVADQDAGFRNKWYKYPFSQSGWLIPMPVPSSFNDVTQEAAIRDFIGWAWYQRYFLVPPSWRALKNDHRIVLNFGSVHYYAQVYLNGVNVLNHTGGHLPFEAEVSNFLDWNAPNNLVVVVNNTLTPHTIPQGSVTYKNDSKRFPNNFYEYSVNFDFFNYAGIHRSVVLYSTPQTYITDVTVTTDIIKKNTGLVSYSVDYVNSTENVKCMIVILDANKKAVSKAKTCRGNVTIDSAHFWWPQGMNSTTGYLYTLQASVLTASGQLDVYSQRFGIRTVKVKGNSFLINDKPFYFMGFGKHEDSNIRGKGLDLPLIIKDFNLIKWIGANCFRTSHYPYAEEIMDQADAQGIVVIDESPAVGLDKFDAVLLKEHKRVMAELVSRDKNRPSVVMWSVANEPSSAMKESEDYFREVVSYTKSLDPTRPVSAALNADVSKDKAGQFMDVIMMNRYFAWYSDAGYLQVIQKQVVNDFSHIYDTYKKPVLISEYGADTIPGLHMSPSFIFTEDFQTDFMMQYHSAFDQLRKEGFFVGEMIWNFADFMTVQQLTRVVGNKKGIFTRERQPKASAKLLRCRYLRLSNATLTDGSLYCPAPTSAFSGRWTEL